MLKSVLMANLVLTFINCAYSEDTKFTINSGLRGTTENLPLDKVYELCSDDDGCEVRLSLRNFSNRMETASRSTHLYINKAVNSWRTESDKSGKFGNSSVEHAIDAFETCYVTDGIYKNGKIVGDQNSGLSLLFFIPSGVSYPQTTTCSVTLRD